MTETKRLVLGISGASGMVLGIKALELLQANAEVETHLILSAACRDYMHYESFRRLEAVIGLAEYYYLPEMLDAPVASGSFTTMGMLVLPCSMKTLAGLATGYSNNLLLRAGDVHLKERRPLVLAVRETPFSLIHLRNMQTLTEAGAVIMPPMVTFYHKPQTLDDMTTQIAARMLEKVGVAIPKMYRWRAEI